MWEEHKAGCPLHPNYQRQASTVAVLTADEWDALWSWHHEKQFQHAEREEYADAQWHKDRADAILPQTSVRVSKRWRPMPVDRQHDRFVFECDSCNETFEGEPGKDFVAAWADAKRDGWKAKQIDGEWVPGCPRHGV